MSAVLLEEDPSGLSKDDAKFLKRLMKTIHFGSEHVAYVDQFNDSMALCLVTMTHGTRYLAEGNFTKVQNNIGVGAAPAPTERDPYIPRQGRILAF
jgi:ABC-type uncharacterized transport system ATPase subunit